MKVIQNPDRNIVKVIRKKLKENDFYCPCSLVKTPDTRCMCKEFKEKLENKELGSCHCGLYQIVND